MHGAAIQRRVFFFSFLPTIHTQPLGLSRLSVKEKNIQLSQVFFQGKEIVICMPFKPHILLIQRWQELNQKYTEDNV